MRRIRAVVEIDGKDREMTFLTNQLDWSAWTVAELYRCRWDIEVFFKELKQTLQLSDFLGNSAHAIRWQIWCGLIVHLLLRLLHFLTSGRTFFRLFALLRACLWDEGSDGSPALWTASFAALARLARTGLLPGFP